MPLLQTQAVASARGYGENLKTGAAVYIEDVFSTWLYTGTRATQTITNGIDLSTKGGLVWVKQRSGTQDHTIFDTARGINNYLRSNSNGAQNPGGTYTDLLTAYNTTGFSLGADASTAGFVNGPDSTYVSWSFKKQPKFFDIVTYTGTGSARTIAHNLGSVPGCIIVRGTSAGTDGLNWSVYHRSLTSASFVISLNSPDPQSSQPSIWNSTAPTSTVFSVGTGGSVNGVGNTYVAYLFAHDAGGFGAAGADNVISCGSFTTDGSGNATVTLGYEPQWVLIKESVTAAGGWIMLDNMRGWSMQTLDNVLYANFTYKESTFGGGNPTATGFVSPYLVPSSTYIYIAIRRGPMKTPTTGTSVFSPVAFTGSNSPNQVVNYGLVNDVHLFRARTTTSTSGFLLSARLMGDGYYVTGYPQQFVSSTVYGVQYSLALNNTTVTYGSDVSSEQNSGTLIGYSLLRASSFCDVVFYTGSGTSATQTHNLNTVPQLILCKRNDGESINWAVYSSAIANTEYLVLNSSAAKAFGPYWNSTTPTSSVFSLGTDASVNGSGTTYTAFLFATVAGVSKVGSYTGTAALQTVNCGFTTGARFVLIKRTDSTGDWYVWDSARGITSGNDPYLLLNTTAAEVNFTNYVDTDATGFKVTAAASAIVNANAATYLFLAIA